jgi:hypothetical protein
MSSNGSLAQRSILLSRLWITQIDWPFQQNEEILDIDAPREDSQRRHLEPRHDALA